MIQKESKKNCVLFCLRKNVIENPNPLFGDAIFRFSKISKKKTKTSFKQINKNIIQTNKNKY